jgi:hypothetical protein
MVKPQLSFGGNPVGIAHIQGFKNQSHASPKSSIGMQIGQRKLCHLHCSLPNIALGIQLTFASQKQNTKHF